MTGLIVIGSGHAGLRAALAARAHGFVGAITMIDRDQAFPPYERPPLSKWKDDEVATVPILPEDRIEQANMTVLHQTVARIDPTAHSLTLGDCTELSYDKLLIATGARARTFALDGVGSIPTLRSKADADAIFTRAQTARSAAIIGGGFIGLELAASFRRLGLPVRVLEAAPRILGRGVPQRIAEIVQKIHENNGVSFQTGVSVTPGDIASIDLVVAGIGAEPNVELAQSAGLDIDNGIRVDAHLRTSSPDILAAGDCCAAPIFGEGHPLVRLEAWTTAGQQGDIAGQNMVASEPVHCRLTPFVWSDQYDHVLQVAGHLSPSQVLVERAYAPDHHISFGLEPDGQLGLAAGIARGARIAKDIRFAMKLMEARIKPPAEALEDPSVNLRALLRG